MPLWERMSVFGGVLLATLMVARLVDRWFARRDLPPEYGHALPRPASRRGHADHLHRRLAPALLVIPQVRAVAAGILASSAVIGIVVGFAAQRTIGNFIAGLLIAISRSRSGSATTSRPTGLTGRRRGDRPHLHVHPDSRQRPARDPEREDRLGYHPKFLHSQPKEARGGDRSRSLSIVISTPSSASCASAGADERDVRVSGIDDRAHRHASACWASDEPAAEQLESELRLRAHARLREAGVFA